MLNLKTIVQGAPLTLEQAKALQPGKKIHSKVSNEIFELKDKPVIKPLEGEDAYTCMFRLKSTTSQRLKDVPVISTACFYGPEHAYVQLHGGQAYTNPQFTVIG
jgi:hypothetical protein